MSSEEEPKNRILQHHQEPAINGVKRNRIEYQKEYRSGTTGKLQREGWLGNNQNYYPIWRENNREKYNQQQKTWRKNNQEKRQPYMCNYMRRYRQCHKLLALMNNLCKTCRYYDSSLFAVTLLRTIDQYCHLHGLYPRQSNDVKMNYH